MTPEEFDQQCRQTGKDWQLIDLRDGHYARFRFSGKFEEKPLIWDAHLFTLAYYFNNVVETGQHQQTARQFIDVGQVDDFGRRITIALNIPEINEPAIAKTIIMVRQYKRLASGRYEYGETVRVDKHV